MAKQKKEAAKPPEYRFLISKLLDERTQKEQLLFTIETTRAFRSFRYDIIMTERHKPKSFVFEINGLTMRNLSTPQTGPAVFEKLLPMLKGEHTFTVINMNEAKSRFKLKFTPKSVKVLQLPTDKFLELELV